MFNEPEIDRDSEQSSENNENDELSAALASLRAIGETLFRIVPTSVDPEMLVEAEGLLNNLLGELDGKLKNSKGISLEYGVLIEKFMEKIRLEIMPSVSVWSLYAQGKIQPSPNYLKDLFIMLKEIGEKLRKLPGKFP